MNGALIAANFIVFILVNVLHQDASRVIEPFVLATSDPRILNFFTYAFLHAGWMHIIGNMLFLYIFGNNVNDKLGNWGYLAFYLAGGVAAGIGYVLTSAAGSSVIGASGAVAAVTGAYLVLFPRSSITVIYFFYLIGTFEVPSVYFIIFFFAKDLFYSFAGASDVAHTAHVGGTVFGFTVSLVLLAVHLLPRDQYDILALFQRWHRRRQYREVVASGFDPFGYGGSKVAQSQRPETPPPVDPKLERIYALRARIIQEASHHRTEQAAALYQQLRNLDPQQVLAQQAQLDVANQFVSMHRYVDAAAAYELFLSSYPTSSQAGQVQLMLGLVYARYLHNIPSAKEHLTAALPKLNSSQEQQMAQEELQRLGQ